MEEIKLSKEQVKAWMQELTRTPGWKLLSDSLNAERREVLKKCLEPNPSLNRLEHTGRDLLLAQVKAMQAVLDNPQDMLTSWGCDNVEVKIDV